jgi:hypothetical protein
MSADAGLPPESVLRYGVQIASALARAHDRSIGQREPSVNFWWHVTMRMRARRIFSRP